MTKQEKQVLYRAGQYEFPAPPVFCGNWEENDWINFIDRSGRWLPKATDLGPAPPTVRNLLWS